MKRRILKLEDPALEKETIIVKKSWKMRLQAVAMLVAFVASGTAATAETRMSIATGSTSGVYYLWGGALAKIWSENIKDVRFNVEATTGQVPNIKLLHVGDVDVAMWNVVSAFESWNGMNKYSDRKYTNQRALFTMYPSRYVMVSLKSSGIKSINDWNGKIISFGTPGGTVDVIGRYILDTLGIKPKKIVNSGWGDVAGQARDSLIDAIGAIGGQPWGPITDLNTTHDLTFYDLSEAQITKLQKDYPYFVKTMMPAGIYKDQKAEYRSLAFWNMVVVHKDISDEIVYQMVKSAFARKSVLEATHPSTAKFFDPKKVLEVASVPLHPGAIRYFKEQGYDIPAKLIP